MRSAVPTHTRLLAPAGDFPSVNSMIKHLLSVAACLMLTGLATSVPAAETAAWVTKSNAAAEPALEYLARYNAEYASSLGLEKYDELISDLNPGVYERSLADGERTLAELHAGAKAESDPKVRQDIDILITSISDQQESTRLDHDLMLPYQDVPKNVFRGLQTLLDERNTPERKARALARLKRYIGIEGQTVPFITLAEARSTERFSDSNLTGPYFEEVRKNLDSTERYITGIADLFKAAKLTGWEQAHAQLATQLRQYSAWVEKEILPRARRTNRLPEAMYADNLKNFGVHLSPRELIERATFGFLEIRDEMQSIAARIAAERKLPSSDYRDVIRELKKDQITGDAVLPFYQHRLEEIEKLIVEHDLVTLPQRKARIRLASDAESSAHPAPHMRPPRLIGNHGEYGEFVLPLTNPTAAAGTVQDDFTNSSFAWTLVAHEARPGHELQFAAMVEQGVSIPRVVFAFNSANVEGWALYCEAVMKPYMPLDGQLFSLQARLHRAARAFLDPMVNLGELQPAEVKQFLMHEVVLSDPFATQEVDRYTYRAPGQATSYYYGYMKIRQIRAAAELALREKFNQKAFHDFILSQGLLPPEVLMKSVKEDFIPKYL
jgi:uncharacterized protein (DUF885 family)